MRSIRRKIQDEKIENGEYDYEAELDYKIENRKFNELMTESELQEQIRKLSIR